MKKNWKWFVAFFLCAGLLFTMHLQERGYIKIDIKKIVYSSEDLMIMRNVLREIFGEEYDTTITVSSDPVNDELLTFVSVKPHDKGYLLSFDEPIPLLALDYGLIVYTGHSQKTGKTISIYYEDDITVTYGFVDSFSLLPYTTIERGEMIANKGIGDLFIQVEKDGEIYNLEETLTWLKESIVSSPK